MKHRIKSVIWKTRKKKIPSQSSQKEERILKNEESLRNILDNMKYYNICIMGLLERMRMNRDQEAI